MQRGRGIGSPGALILRPYRCGLSEESEGCHDCLALDRTGDENDPRTSVVVWPRIELDQRMENVLDAVNDDGAVYAPHIQDPLDT